MEKIIILDTETTNSLDDPMAYDFAFLVADFDGNIYERKSFVVADIFLDKELMASAYFKEKVPQYWKDIKNGTRELKTFRNIVFETRGIMKKYGITKVFAYNCRFDYISTATTQRYITSSKYRYVFPYGTEFHDILALSRHALKNNVDYRAFCEENDYLTKRNANRYTAEIVAQFLFDRDFIEEHTALADCEIEYKILLECRKDNEDYATKMW